MLTSPLLELDLDPEVDLPADWLPERLDWLAPRAAVVFAARSCLRALPCLDAAPRAGRDRSALDRLRGALFAALRTASAFCAKAVFAPSFLGEAVAVRDIYGGLANKPGFDGLGPVPWAVGSAGARLVVAVVNGLGEPDPAALRPAVRRAVAYALRAVRLGADASPESDREARSLRVAAEHDFSLLYARPARLFSRLGAEGPLGPLWPPVGGPAPTWYRRFLRWVEGLTARDRNEIVGAVPRRESTPQKRGDGPADLRDAAGPAVTPEQYLELLVGLKRRILETVGPFRDEFRLLVDAMRGKSFGALNGQVTAELNVLMGLLGLHFADPENPDSALYLRTKQAPGTKGGAIELRAQGKQKSVYSRTRMPEELLIVEDGQASGKTGESGK